jgi:histidinol-phosphate aminotransferase
MELKKKLCAFRGIPSESHFYLGVGSDECIDMAMRVFVRPGVEKVLITPPTYGMYSVCATINDVGLVKVPLLENFQLDLPKVFSIS